MPYISQEDRERINLMLDSIESLSPGELNYAITTIILSQLPAKPSYAQYNEKIGVLECVKQELYRKAVAPYEETKIKENGDIEWSVPT